MTPTEQKLKALNEEAEKLHDQLREIEEQLQTVSLSELDAVRDEYYEVNNQLLALIPKLIEASNERRSQKSF